MSRKYPKTPKSSYDPKYEAKPVKERGGKDWRFTPLEGCGDPNCPQCNPKGNSNMLTEQELRQAYERAMKVTSLRDILYGDGVRAFTAREETSSLSEARKAVEPFILKTSHQVAWESIIGQETAKQAFAEVLEWPIKHRDLYELYGMKPSKGVLLWGPPGNGKTMLAKAVASHLARIHGKETEMLVVNATSIMSKWWGGTEKHIREMFAYAREWKKTKGTPLVIFIDEADAILGHRGSNYAQSFVPMVSTFLAEMDGLEESGAFIILATNRPDSIDEAILRDGRIDRKIKVERPGLETIKTILASVLISERLPVNVHLNEVADFLVAPQHIVKTLHKYNAQGPTGETIDLTLAHIISGAMVVGLIARAKSIAFQRELAADTHAGLIFADFEQAILDLVRENKGLSHDSAVEEVTEMYETNLKKKGMN